MLPPICSSMRNESCRGLGRGGGEQQQLAWQLASPAATNIKIENFVIFLFWQKRQRRRRHCAVITAGGSTTPSLALSSPLPSHSGYMSPYLCPLLGNNMHECAIFAVGTWHRSRGYGYGSDSASSSQLELVQGSLRASCGKF